MPLWCEQGFGGGALSFTPAVSGRTVLGTNATGFCVEALGKMDKLVGATASVIVKDLTILLLWLRAAEVAGPWNGNG